MKNGANRMIMFNNLKGYRGYRLLTNVLGSDSRIFFATGTTDLENFYDNYYKAFVEQSPRKPSIISGLAPFKERIMKGNSVDLFHYFLITFRKLSPVIMYETPEC